MDNERWVEVVGFEGLYEVSDLGRIRSLPVKRKANYGVRTYGGKILKNVERKKDGYMVVNLYKDRKKYQWSVHAVVLRSFVGMESEGMECCHNNGIRRDCRLENLRWGSAKENALDKAIHGNLLYGENNPSSKLSEIDVKSILSSRLSHAETASIYGVSDVLIGKIRSGESWRHVERPSNAYKKQKSIWLVEGIAYQTLNKAAEASGEKPHVVRYKCQGRKSGGKTYPAAQGYGFMVEEY